MRSVLISGTSSGMGLQTAIALARRNWRVFATMRDLSRSGDLERAAVEAGVTVERLALDVRDQATIDSCVAEIHSRTNFAIDAVVHNAGIGDAGYFEDMTDDAVRNIFDTNFFGVLALTRAVLPAMRARRSGRIIAVSSVGAFFPSPALSAYQASKRAIEAWAESLAMEVRPFGIHVSLVEPGSYKTAIWDNAVVHKVDGSPYQAYADVMEPRMMKMVERTGRDPAEVARRVVRLVEARRPRLRNPVGPDAHIMRVLGHLPARTRHRMVARVTGARTVADPGAERSL